MANVWFENPSCDVFDVGNQCKAAEPGAAGPQCPGLLPGGHPLPRLSGRFVSLPKQQGVMLSDLGERKPELLHCSPSQRCCSKDQAAFGQVLSASGGSVCNSEPDGGRRAEGCGADLRAVVLESFLFLEL